MKKSSVLLSLAVAASAFSMSATANAGVVTFEDQAAFRCETRDQTSGGLSFDHDFAACYYSPSSPADFPTAPTSTVMAIGYSATTVTRAGAGLFDLQSVDLAFGPFSHKGASSDTTLVTGFFGAGGTVTTTLTVDYSFDTYNLNWTGLTSVVFGELGTSEYLAFDNVTFAVANEVPEPTSIALLGVGIAGFLASRRKTLKSN